MNNVNRQRSWRSSLSPYCTQQQLLKSHNLRKSLHLFSTLSTHLSIENFIPSVLFLFVRSSWFISMTELLFPIFTRITPVIKPTSSSKKDTQLAISNLLSSPPLASWGSCHDKQRVFVCKSLVRIYLSYTLFFSFFLFLSWYFPVSRFFLILLVLTR